MFDAEEDRNIYESYYYQFILSLNILAADPEEQCERQGNFNVAWEIKNEIASGAWLVNSPSCNLTLWQKSSILSLVESLESIPADVTSFTDIRQESLAKMKHSSWAPLRQVAKKTLLILVSATLANKNYFEDYAKKPFKRTARGVALFLTHALNGTLFRQDWEGFLQGRMDGAPEMDAVRVQCTLLDRFNATGSGEKVSFTQGARLKIEQLLKQVNSKI